MTRPENVQHFLTPETWRQWLELNHESEKEIWILIKKAKSDAAGIRLAEAVTEALSKSLETRKKRICVVVEKASRKEEQKD